MSSCGFAPRFLSTVGRPSAVALCFVRYGQLTRGLSPPRCMSCWACKQRGPDSVLNRGLKNKSGIVLLFHTVTHIVPSALRGLTALFGMGRGVTPSI